MRWREDILSGLPSPRGDEPSGLRRDIEDELADHLACATARELTGEGVDEVAARRAVLARFGNPRLVAYKLYWDAMKEKIMKDRLIMGALIVFALASLCALGLSFTAMQQSRKTNEAMLSKLDTIATQIEDKSVPPHQSILRVETREIGTDKPAGNIGFYMDGHEDGAPEQDNYTGGVTTDGGGKFRKTLRPGKYRMYYPAPTVWIGPGASEKPFIFGAYRYQEGMTLYGGEAKDQKILVPPGETGFETRKMTVQFQWLEELKRQISAAAGNGDSSSTYFTGVWVMRDPDRQEGWVSDPIELTLNRNGEIIPGASTDWNPDVKYWGSLVYYNLSGDPHRPRTNPTDENKIPKTRELTLHPGKYKIVAICVRKMSTAAPFDGNRGSRDFVWGEIYKTPQTFTVDPDRDGTLKIELPEKITQGIVKSLKPEATFDLSNHETNAIFHDLQIEFNGITEGDNGWLLIKTIDQKIYRLDVPLGTTVRFPQNALPFGGRPDPRFIFEFSMQVITPMNDKGEGGLYRLKVSLPTTSTSVLPIGPAPTPAAGKN